jgi:hypothetical protein
MRIRMLSLENDVRRANEEKQKSERERQRIEAEVARLRNQQPQIPTRAPIPDPQIPASGRTPEQLAAREFVAQWSNGYPQPQMAHNDTQSTMTGLAGQFNNMHVNHAHEIEQMLERTADAATANIPVERLHLANSEDQHIKAFAQQVESNEMIYKSKIENIAMMKMMQNTSGTDMTLSIAEAMAEAQRLAIKLRKSKEQMKKVKALSEIFNVEIPQPIIRTPPPGSNIRRGDGPNLKYIEKRVPAFDPDKDPNACFKIFMEDLNEIASDQYYSEGDWRAIFDCLLRGETRYEYKQCLRNGKTFMYIVQHLGKMYTKKKSIEDEQKELEKFARRPQEDLIKAMGRYETQITKLQYLYDAHVFPNILQVKMEQGLMAMVTPKTKQHLVMKNTEALLTGAPLQFSDLLKQAEKFEKNYNEVPTMPLSISSNTVDLQRTITAQNSKINDLMKKTPQYTDEFTSEVKDFISVASAHFKRERSLEKKAASSKPAYRSSSGGRKTPTQQPQQQADVEMTDVSYQTKSYPDKKNRADRKYTDEKSKREKEKLKKMYEEKKKAGLIPSTYNKGYNQDNRGRSNTPGKSNEQRSSSNTSQKSSGSHSRSNSANNDNKQSAHSQLSIDIWHDSNYLTCTLCTLQHPPYRELCPASGNA